MFKVGIVGCGGIGNAHANSWKQIEGVQVVAVCDLDIERAKKVAANCGAEPITDMNQLPADLDCVSVVTPPRAHYPIVKAMLNRGYNVFSEKPLTLDPAEGNELDALAKAKKLQLGVGFKMRFEPIFQEARKYVPELGKLISIVTTKEQEFHSDPAHAWVTKVGAMYELSIHDFDLISFITGIQPKEVIGAKVNFKRGWEMEDSFHAIVNYGDGITGMLQGCYCDKTTFCFRDLTITLLGENGYMRIERPDRIVIHTDALRVVDVPAATKSAFVCELEHFRDACQGKCENTLKAADAVNMTRLIEEIRAKGR